MTHNSSRTFFLHLPEGDRLYVCIIDEKQRALDFTDNTFKVASRLAHHRDACLLAAGRSEPRAYHDYSYSVEIDLSRLLKGADPETIPAKGAKVAVHWLRQVGDKPDLRGDTLLRHPCNLRNVGGRFEPDCESDADQLDENRLFAERQEREAECGALMRREADTLVVRCDRLETAVRAGNISGVLRVLAEDICDWTGNLKEHLYQTPHCAKDPLFVQMRMVPRGEPFQVHEYWVVRDWIGVKEAYDLLEFCKSTELARSFSARLRRLHKARIEFSRNVTEYIVQTRGEDVEGLFVLDEARKRLKRMAISRAEYLELVALQFEAASRAMPSAVSGDRPRVNASRGDSEAVSDVVIPLPNESMSAEPMKAAAHLAKPTDEPKQFDQRAPTNDAETREVNRVGFAKTHDLLEDILDRLPEPRLPDVRPDSPTLDYSLPSPGQVKWLGETTIPRRLWDLLRAVLGSGGRPTTFDRAAREMGAAEDLEPKTIRNYVSDLNTTLLHIKWPFTYSTKSGNIYSTAHDLPATA
jgi:hypothetical protein